MATTKTKICNKAIARVGGELITDIDTDTSNEATWCNALWDDIVDEILTMYDWSFARALKELTADGTDPDFEYDYRYALPSDPYCLRVRELYDNTSDYKIHGRYIHTDAEEVELIYTKRITSVTEFSPLFINALATLLAARIAGVMDQQKLARELEVVFLTQDLPMAKWEDAGEQSLNEEDEELWTDSMRE